MNYNIIIYISQYHFYDQMDAVLPREIVLEVLVSLDTVDLFKYEGIFNLNDRDYLFLLGKRFPVYNHSNLYKYNVKKIYNTLLDKSIITIYNAHLNKSVMGYVGIPNPKILYKELMDGFYRRDKYTLLRYMICEDFITIKEIECGYHDLVNMVLNRDDLPTFIKIRNPQYHYDCFTSKAVTILEYLLSNPGLHMESFFMAFKNHLERGIINLEIVQLVFKYLKIQVDDILEFIENYNINGPADVRMFLIDKLPLDGHLDSKVIMKLFQKLTKVQVVAYNLYAVEHLWDKYHSVFTINQMKRLHQRLTKIKSKPNKCSDVKLTFLIDTISQTIASLTAPAAPSQ